MNMYTKIYIVRHGQTAMNHAKMLQGRSDTALNETGIRQAEMTAVKLKEMGIGFDHVFSSPLVRARETAALISGRPAQIQVDDRLIEMDYGPYEGMDLSDPDEKIRTFFSDFVHNPAPEGMEPLHHVTERLGSFLEEIRKSHLSGNILISTHAIAMKGALEYLSPDSKGSWWSKYIGNCAVYMCEIKNGQFSVPEEVRLTDIIVQPGV
ncbi:MAG: histidine phosphatase family protein [Solobacterium sp.]|nr:histidine phosphatase family protein [Solobacterium sp.]